MSIAFREVLLEGGSAAAVRAPREARLPSFIGMDEGVGEKLGRLRICLVGCGSVGQSLALHLARVQIAEMRLIDSGQIKDTSLLTHCAAFPEDLGQPKAAVLGRRIKELSPRTRVHVFDGPVQKAALTDLASADLIALASDNLACEVFVGRISRILGLPLIQSSVHGASLVAQTRFFANGSKADPCVVCGFTRAEFQAMNSQIRFSCEAGLPGNETAQNTGPVTQSLSVLCSIGGELAVLQMLRSWLNLGRQEQVRNTMLEYCAYTHATMVCPLKRNPRCPGEHEVYQQVSFHHPIPECSARQLLMAAGLGTESSYAGVSLRLEDLIFCDRGRCGCSVAHPFGRFHYVGRGKPLNKEIEICKKCGQEVKPQRFYSHQRVPVDSLGGILDRPLSDLGVLRARWAMIRGPESGGGVLVVN